MEGDPAGVGASALVDPPARLRMNRTALFPVALLMLSAVPLAFAAPWTPVLLLVPLAVAVWVLRAGVDVTADGLTVRTLAGQRQVRWDEMAGIRVGRRGDVWLVTTRGTQVHVPVMRARDLPRIAELSGGRIDVVAPDQ